MRLIYTSLSHDATFECAFINLTLRLLAARVKRETGCLCDENKPNASEQADVCYQEGRKAPQGASGTGLWDVLTAPSTWSLVGESSVGTGDKTEWGSCRKLSESAGDSAIPGGGRQGAPTLTVVPKLGGMT